MDSVSIILPTYNERENIRVLIPQIVKEMKMLKGDYEIIVVDDNSPDGTALLAKELSEKNRCIKLVLNEQNAGIGLALRLGFERASKKILLSMDADCSVKPTEIPLLLREIENGYDVILGSRYSDRSFYEKRGVQAIISKFGNAYMTFISGVQVRDFSLNFRAFRAEALGQINATADKNFYLVQQVISAKRKKLRIKEIPVSFMKRKYGESKTRIWSQMPIFFLGIVMERLKPDPAKADKAKKRRQKN